MIDVLRVRDEDDGADESFRGLSLGAGVMDRDEVENAAAKRLECLDTGLIMTGEELSGSSMLEIMGVRGIVLDSDLNITDRNESVMSTVSWKAQDEMRIARVVESRRSWA